ncbi:hypothetical protein PtA15_8A216 [Puccinia triticina]|uniref:Uncharacterized protein n=1 Tax=Puccinia triticina TaxID=208348 RepID=A0ABY7CX67_9BASI|nr:uncharacterized protein PtA15_8A216 [Puccinia triticina]WAQ87312.1 hypothetical protein PtA15_8A216 [Puccinia triticina]WAR57166.1 hypothetical protein PtB15_8B213 [Puccinia triticina]
MTEEEKNEAERKAAELKKASLGSSYRKVLQTGVFMEKVCSCDRYNAAHATHKQMQKDAQNPKWDYGPPLMTLVLEMVEWGQNDVFPREFYIDGKVFSTSAAAVQAFKVILELDFQLCLRQCPGLIQVAANHPFFNKDVICLELIKQARESEDESLYDTGDPSATPSHNDVKRRNKMCLSAFGLMAVFFLYGAAGWWHDLTDLHNYNKHDVWALVHLAHAKHKWLYKQGHFREQHQEETPWYCHDSFVRWLLVECGFESKMPEVYNWGFIPQFLSTKVSKWQLSQFALHNILHEVCCTGPANSPAPPPSSDKTEGHAADNSATHNYPKSSKIHSNSTSPNPVSRPKTKHNKPLKRGQKLIAVVVPAEHLHSTKKTWPSRPDPKAKDG